jgi:hypothetical protein
MPILSHLLRSLFNIFFIILQVLNTLLERMGGAVLRDLDTVYQCSIWNTRIFITFLFQLLHLFKPISKFWGSWEQGPRPEPWVHIYIFSSCHYIWFRIAKPFNPLQDKHFQQAPNTYISIHLRPWSWNCIKSKMYMITV